MTATLTSPAHQLPIDLVDQVARTAATISSSRPATSSASSKDTAAHQLPLDVFGHIADMVPDTAPADGRATHLLDLGPFDGLHGELAHRRPRPDRFGLAVDAHLDDYALLLLTGDLVVRKRRDLHRTALLSQVTTGSDRDLLRAGTLWLQALTAAARVDQPDATRVGQFTGQARTEIAWAVHGLFELGAAKLAIRVAARWTQPGARAEGEDLRQVAQEALLEGLLQFNDDLGIVSTYVHPKINCRVSEYVRKTEHEGMPRTAFKKRGEIKAAYRSYLAEVADGTRNEMDHDEVVALIVARIPSVTTNGVARVLFGSGSLSLDADIAAEGAGYRLSDTVADTPERSCPNELFESAEVVAQIVAAAGDQLGQTERELLMAHFGLGDEPPQTYRQLEVRYGKSRAWIGTRIQRAIAKLQHPMIIGDLLALESDPSELTDGSDRLASRGWTDELTDRQRFVARAFFGFGGAQLPGDANARRDRIAVLLDVPNWLADRLIGQVAAVHAGRNVPALYDPWFYRLTARQQDAARIVLGYGSRTVTGTVDQRLAKLAGHLQVSPQVARALAAAAAKVRDGRDPVAARPAADEKQLAA